MIENINSNRNSIIQVITYKQQNLITQLVKSMHCFEVLILIINKFNDINKSQAQIKQIIKKVRRTEVILIKFFIIKNYYI